MLALRYAALLAVAIWVGGLLGVGGIAAPAVFEVLDARAPAEGRMLAGAIGGEILRRFHLVSYACGAVVLISLAARAVLGPRPRRFAIRAGLAALMLGVTLYSGLILSPQIEGAREAIGTAPSRLPESDPRRVAFGRLHGQSTALQFVPLVGGLLLMFWELRD